MADIRMPLHVPLGLGQQCDSFLPRYALQCREFRGLKWYKTDAGFRAYCWRHGPMEEKLGNCVPAPGGPLAEVDIGDISNVGGCHGE